MTMVAIHQPNFFPAMSYFKKMKACDKFVLYDDAQYTRGSFINRNRIDGVTQPIWLTVPVHYKYGQPIKDIRIREKDAGWAKKHYRSIEMNYKKFKNWEIIQPKLQKLYSLNWTNLSELNVATIEIMRDVLNIDTPMVLSSELDYEKSNDPTQNLVNITRACGGDTYLTGQGGDNYINWPDSTWICLERMPRHTHTLSALHEYLKEEFL